MVKIEINVFWKKKDDVEAFEKESNLTETKETESIESDLASNNPKSMKANDKEDGSKKLFPIFDPNSVFVFNATSKNVKAAASKTRHRKDK